MTFITKRYINTIQGQIHSRISNCPDNTIPLVMLHQTASSSVMYEKLIMRLSGTLGIIAPDTPGYGESFDPSTPPTIEYYADILHELLTQFEIQSCYLFGHHTGAAIAVQFIQKYPDMVDKLMLSGPPLLSEKQKEQLSRGLAKGKLDTDGGHLKKVWKRIYSRSLSGDLNLIQRETLLTLRASRYHESYQAVFEQDFAEQVKNITCPTLIICGEQDTIRDSAEPTHALIPHSELIFVPDAGTYICDENIEEVFEILRSFLLD